jgi:hypothetical protein
MTRRRALGALMAGLLALAGAGCARQPTVGGDLALLFIPTPIRLIGCVLGGCERTPVEGEYKGEMSQ